MAVVYNQLQLPAWQKSVTVSSLMGLIPSPGYSTHVRIQKEKKNANFRNHLFTKNGIGVSYIALSLSDAVIDSGAIT